MEINDLEALFNELGMEHNPFNNKKAVLITSKEVIKDGYLFKEEVYDIEGTKMTVTQLVTDEMPDSIRKSLISSLESELADAVQKEQYELAAKLKSRLEELKD